MQAPPLTQEPDFIPSTIALPHALGPEKSVLSSIFQDPQEYIDRAQTLSLMVDDFYHPANQTLYEMLITRHNNGQSLDLVTLSQELLDQGLIGSLGGPAGIQEIYTYSPTGAYFDSHVNEVKQKSLLRKIIHTTTEALAEASDPSSDPGELLERLETKTMALRSSSDMTDSSLSMKDLMKDSLAYYQSCAEGQTFGLPSGFPNIDYKTGGLHNGDLVIIAARPSMGKTALAMAWMEHISHEENHPCLFFSTEMGSRAIGHRSIASFGRVDLASLNQGIVTKGLLMDVKSTAKKLINSPLRVIDTPSMTASAIRARARREHRKHGIKAIFIDYLQLLTGSTRSEQDDPNRRISNALKVLKNMARELDIPVVVLAQLSRAAEDKTAHQLNNSMIKDCGEAEQDADAIYMIGKPKDPEEDETSVQRIINITKQRQGPTGCVAPVTFLKTFARFTA